MRCGLSENDADEGVVVDVDGYGAQCNSEDAWMGVRGRPGVLHGAYQFEVELRNECLLRVGWAAITGRRALGTDSRSFGYGGTAMKSNSGKFMPYGEVHEGIVGAVITCLLDRKDPRRQTISYCLDGRPLGVAFDLPTWLAEEPLFPAICGREDWHVSCRFAQLTCPVQGYAPLAAGVQGDVISTLTADVIENSNDTFAPAPRIGRRELTQFDVPNENLLELQSNGDESLELLSLKRWLADEHDDCECHVEVAADCHTAVVAFASHRIARSVFSAPPAHTIALRRVDFTSVALELVQRRQPAKQATTDRVARRFIAAALQDDPKMTQEQLKQIRDPRQSRNPPPAPPMPELSVDVLEDSAEGDDGFKVPKPEDEDGNVTPEQTSDPSLCALPVKRGASDQHPTLVERRVERKASELVDAMTSSNATATKHRPTAGNRLLAGALRGLGDTTRARNRGPRNALG